MRFMQLVLETLNRSRNTASAVNELRGRTGLDRHDQLRQAMPNSTASATPLLMAGITRTAVVLVLTTPAICDLVAIGPGIAGGVTRNSNHVDTNRAYRSHCFELLKGQCAA